MLVYSHLQLVYPVDILLKSLDNQTFSVMENKNILLHSMTPQELKEILREMIQEEFQIINYELQRVMGEDDLVSTGTACRLLGMSSKMLRYLLEEGHFTVFHHMKERRYIRAELLEFRNRKRWIRKNNSAIMKSK